MASVVSTGPEPIVEVAERLGLEQDELFLYGPHAAKVDLSAIERRSGVPDGKLVCVTSITPTPAGEGKTTSAISLVDGFGAIGESAVACLREPSVGPVFGIKGGGTGGGHAQLVPAAAINLHFTGDIHAIGAANNLLAAMLETHLLHGNPLGIDPHSITFKRCLDVNDRALRQVVVGLGGRLNGAPRETGFDITAASEVMAILAVSRDVQDLRRRLGAITVAATGSGEPVTAEMLGAAGSMTALLVDAIKPNLVQTLEGRPAFVHCGPFANIALGNSSLVADLVGLKVADYIVTESGFGADLGLEKFLDILARSAGLSPSAVVVVVTVRALKHHGGDPEGGLAALELGAENLAAHLRIVREFGLAPVVAVNRFPGDSAADVDAVQRLALDRGAHAAVVNAGFELGGQGATAFAEAVASACSEPAPFEQLYSLEDSIPAKIEAIARRAYGAAGIDLSPAAAAQAARFEADGLGGLPICMAKTHLSLSHDPLLTGAPTGFTLPIRELRAYTGAGWIVALCGAMQTMPGLSSKPAALDIDVSADGEIVGLR
jgi:formate--tetrahydrofolate ligase